MSADFLQAQIAAKEASTTVRAPRDSSETDGEEKSIFNIAFEEFAVLARRYFLRGLQLDSPRDSPGSSLEGAAQRGMVALEELTDDTVVQLYRTVCCVSQLLLLVALCSGQPFITLFDVCRHF